MMNSLCFCPGPSSCMHIFNERVERSSEDDEAARANINALLGNLSSKKEEAAKKGERLLE